MSQLFELCISPEIEGISRMEPAGGWSSNNTFRIKLKCGNCKDDTKFLPLCMEKVTKSSGCNAHIIHKVRIFIPCLFFFFIFLFFLFFFEKLLVVYLIVYVLS